MYHQISLRRMGTHLYTLTLHFWSHSKWHQIWHFLPCYLRHHAQWGLTVDKWDGSALHCSINILQRHSEWGAETLLSASPAWQTLTGGWVAPAAWWLPTPADWLWMHSIALHHSYLAHIHGVLTLTRQKCQCQFGNEWVSVWVYVSVNVCIRLFVCIKIGVAVG